MEESNPGSSDVIVGMLINTVNMQSNYIALLESIVLPRVTPAPMLEQQWNFKQVKMIEKPKRRVWTEEEHEKFLQATELYGKSRAKEIAEFIGTKTSTQVRSHAQKHYKKLEKLKK